MIIDFTELSSKQIYHVMTQTVIPRPIAWVLSENKNNSYNLAPFSYFTAVSSNPPIIMFSAGKKPDGSLKDTVVNIKRNKECVIHIASDNLAEEVTLTSKGLDYGESELSLVSLNTVDFDCPLPRIKECFIAFYCTLYECQEMGKVPQSLVFGEIQKAFVDDGISSDNNGRIKISADGVKPLARLGGTEYSSISNIISIARPE